MPNSKTLSEKGAKSVPVKTTNSQLLKYTVVLGGFSNGVKLPPSVLFAGSGKKLKKTLKSNKVHYFFTESGNMTKSCLQEWFEKV